jgi:DNA mismatch repair ATPase MutL
VRQDSGEPRRLLVPVRVPVPAVIAARVEERAEELASLGLVASRFSPGEVVVRAVPDAAREVDPADVLRVALGADDVREAWADRLPVAEVPEDLLARVTALDLPLGPLVGRVELS